MRLTRFALALTAFLLPLLAFQASAQRQDRVHQTFRSVDERIATARRLGVRGILEVYLNTSFTLTARQPYVQGRGWIETFGAHEFVPRLSGNLAGQDELGQGWISLFPGASTLYPDHPATLNNRLVVGLENVGDRRFLVECMVSSAHVVRAHAGSASAQLNGASREWLSIVTPPGGDRVQFSADPNVVWYVMGCEVTPLQ